MEKEKKFDISQCQKVIEAKVFKILNFEYEIKKLKTAPKEKTIPKGILKMTSSGKFQGSTPTRNQDISNILPEYVCKL